MSRFCLDGCDAMVSIGGCKPCTIFPNRAHNELAPTQIANQNGKPTNDKYIETVGEEKR